MKTVLITGSAGFVGKHLVDHFVEKGFRVVGLDSFRHRGDSLRVTNQAYTVYCHDLTAPISDRLIQQIGSVDYIINAASESHVDRSITEPVPFVENNVKLVLNILEYARTVKPKIFFQVSTDEVYGPAPEGILHAEWSPILPSNPYAASKAAQEAVAISYWRTYGVPVVITNTMNMFGEMQDKEKYIPMLISRIMRNQIVTVHGTPDYIGKRFYLHARNFADALHYLINFDGIMPILYEDLRSDRPDRFNVVGEQELDNLQLAQKVAKLLGKELKYELVDFHSCRPGHDRRYALDGSKMKSYGWQIPVHLDEALERTIKWTLENQVWL